MSIARRDFLKLGAGAAVVWSAGLRPVSLPADQAMPTGQAKN